MDQYPVAVIALLITLATSPAALAGEAVDAEAAARFHGTWTYAGGETEDQARMDAIDAAAAEVIPLARKIVRGQIGKATTPSPTYEIDVDGDQITVTSDKIDEPTTTSLDGTPVTLKNGASLSRTLDGDTIVIRLDQPRAWSEGRWRLGSDGDTLIVEVAIGSKHMPKDVEYSLTYTRD